jgi:hypothetical protein
MAQLRREHGRSASMKRKWARRAKKSVIAAGITVALAAGIALGASSQSALLDRYLLIQKPQNAYYSQGAFSQLQRQSEAIDADSRYSRVGSYFQVAMIKQNVPVGKMLAAAGEIKKVYRQGTSLYDGQMQADGIIRKYAGLGNVPSFASAAAQSLYNVSGGLSNLQEITASMQTSISPKIADFYFTTLIYYGISDPSGAIESYLYTLATDQNASHKGISTSQEISLNSTIAEKATQNIALIYASRGGLKEVKYYFNTSPQGMYKATQAAVDSSRIKNRVIIPSILASPVVGAGALMILGNSMQKRDLRKKDRA